MKIALFGGSFDPPHLGHDSVVKNALKSLDIDKLIIMPTYISPFKSSFYADEKQRFRWAKKVWGGLDRVELCDFEIRQNRPVPSIETALYLQEFYNPSKFYLIIGADNLKGLRSWHDFDKLSSIVEFIIAKRSKIAIPRHFKQLNTNIDISSSSIRSNLNLSEICPQVVTEVKRYYEGLFQKQEENKLLEEKVRKIVTVLEDKKARELRVFDMRDKDYFVSFVIIASSLAQKHSASLVDEIQRLLKPLKEEPLNIQSSEEWTVIDLGDLLIHLLSEEYRARYKIEDLLDELKGLL